MKDPTRSGFTLIEMLTAIAVLALMMVFMFNIASQSVRAWEVGSRRMEAAQSARIGMDLMARELRYAYAGVATNYGTNLSQPFYNFVPFYVYDVTNNVLPGQANSDLVAVPGSQSLFFVAPVGPHDPAECAPFAEIGYLTTFVQVPGGRNNMMDGTYALVRHGASPGVYTTNSGNDKFQDFYFHSTNSDFANAAKPINSARTNWTTNAATTGSRTPIVDNCIRFTMQFAYTNNQNSVQWTNNWTNATNLPMGVLLSLLVLDSRSAAKLRQLGGLTPLPAATIDMATNDAPTGTNTLARIIREGVTEVRRFVPLVNRPNY